MAKKLIQLSRKSLTLLELTSPGHTTHQSKMQFSQSVNYKSFQLFIL